MSASATDVDDIGEVELALTQVPRDVQCVHIEARGSRTVARQFDVTAGTSAQLVMFGLPLGQVEFSGKAYNERCAQIVPTSEANWVSERIVAMLVSGVRAHVALIMRRNATAVVDIDFEEEVCDSEPMEIVPDTGSMFVKVSEINDLGEVAGSTYPDGAPVPFTWRDGVTKLLDLSYAEASHINNAGQVVGVSGSRGFFWDSHNQQSVTASFGGSIFTSVTGMNDAGEVVGYYLGNADSHYHAFQWRPELGTVNFEASDNGDTIARAINAAGHVVGEIQDIRLVRPHAFFSTETVMRDLGTLGGNYSTANDINGSDMVVGEASIPNEAEIHAFAWSGGNMRDLGTLGGTHSNAQYVNERGQVVGRSETSSGDWHAFIWEDGTMRDLGAFGGGESSAAGINNAGQVVGSSEGRGFIWQDGVMREAGIGISRMRGINNRGEAIGERCGAGSTDADLCGGAVLLCANRVTQ